MRTNYDETAFVFMVFGCGSAKEKPIRLVSASFVHRLGVKNVFAATSATMTEGNNVPEPFKLKK